MAASQLLRQLAIHDINKKLFILIIIIIIIIYIDYNYYYNYLYWL